MFLLKDKPEWQNPVYDFTQEIWSSATHGVGLGLSVLGLVILIILGVTHGNIWLLISFIVYGSSLIILYLASTIYHGVQKPSVKRKLRVFDHIGIYLLIAGTYTPFMLAGIQHGLNRTLGLGMLALIWGLAFFGILWKLFFFGKFEILAVIGYILMGVAGMALIKEMLATVPAASVIWLIIGGAIYIMGVFFYAIKKIPYNHVIWHFFVMSASAAHFIAVLALLH